jgi:hypothetical protein
MPEFIEYMVLGSVLFAAIVAMLTTAFCDDPPVTEDESDENKSGSVRPAA